MKTIKDLHVALAEAQDPESKDYVEDWTRDGWDREFVLLVVPADSGLRVRVLSWGTNGIDEEGGGDDLYVEKQIVSGSIETKRRYGK